jgi:threonyl-tRNA synthetase
MLIAGDEDVAANAVSFRFRDGTQENGISVPVAISRIAEIVKARKQL